MVRSSKHWRPTHAMVLAAGKGTRMRHLSAHRPKPLTPLMGRTLLDHVLDRIAAVGINDAVVNVHHLADMIEAALAGRKSPRITISDERAELLETGGGVTRALGLLGQGPFLIQNSDCVWCDSVADELADLCAAWDVERMDTLLLLAPITQTLGYEGRGDFTLTSDGLIRRRPAREDAPFVFAGVSIAHPRVFNDAPDGPFSLNLLWDRAIAANRAYGLRMSGTWMHVGTPEALDAAEELMRDGSDRERDFV